MLTLYYTILYFHNIMFTYILVTIFIYCNPKDKLRKKVHSKLFMCVLK